MTGFQMFQKLEDWDEIATKQQWQPEWVEHIGLSLSVYISERLRRNKGVSLAGFIEYLEQSAPHE